MSRSPGRLMLRQEVRHIVARKGLRTGGVVRRPVSSTSAMTSQEPPKLVERLPVPWTILRTSVKVKGHGHAIVYDAMLSKQ